VAAFLDWKDDNSPLRFLDRGPASDSERVVVRVIEQMKRDGIKALPIWKRATPQISVLPRRIR